MSFDYKNIWQMSYPILISMFMQQLIGITDVVYLGRLGEIELGASALGSTYFFTLFMVAFGFSVGAQIIMARRNGEKNYTKIGEVFYQGCSFLIFAALVFILLSFILAPYLLSSLINSKQIYHSTLEYVNWRVWGLIAASILMMMRSFFVSITKTYVLSIVSVAMVLANMCLNYVLIFGKFGLPKMGIAGAALASNLSEIIAVCVFAFYFLFFVDTKHFGLNKIVFSNLKLLKSILNVSVWTMLQQFISLSTWFLFFVAIEHLGEKELAVSNILKSLSSFPFVVVNAFGAAVSSIISNQIGNGQTQNVLESCRRTIKLCALILLPLIFILSCIRVPVVSIFTDKQDLIIDSAQAYQVMLWSFLPLIPGWILFNGVSGTGNTRYTMVIEFYAMLGYTFFIFLVVLYLKMPLKICWFADWVYNSIILILSYLYMRSGKWKNRQI